MTLTIAIFRPSALVRGITSLAAWENPAPSKNAVAALSHQS